MSRAFVKEDSEGRWEPPKQSAAYHVYHLAPDGEQLVRDGDDLAALLRWVAARERGRYEIRDASGTRLARVD